MTGFSMITIERLKNTNRIERTNGYIGTIATIKLTTYLWITNSNDWKD